jgi:hypothetical protein
MAGYFATVGACGSSSKSDSSLLLRKQFWRMLDNGRCKGRFAQILGVLALNHLFGAAQII